ncbi:DUF5692 family protein [Clostridium gasigenes]|uniref:Uncharacterized protein n=1 Tax=Clostridium gasigenes TaxID=94869 RepID=A0A1H0NNN9_9CLOT|nr:DUF5692 family protein [Clostridium gasigenes]MBB6623627.1 hypothetical protein [Clostridium gasigenes]MBU3087572.1 hypothetical protein [Clostridium gasigenes]MBU3106829.1 hypothetical protein [Clostridium gasigenes]SDO94382.1 hypothetical protein SAMN04488529_101896 [Clostridium gasigenes]
MFLFESIPWYSVVIWVLVIGGLMLSNELARRNKYIAIISFIVLPIILPFAVWKNTAGPGSSVGSWFHWAKVYSALAGCLGFMALRYSKKLSKNKYLLAFPAIILAVNIMEAVIRDFQCYSFDGVVDGMLMIGGPWNIMNGIAGILNIITISGFVGIFIGKDKNKDMLWPDQLWFWIIAYDFWNFAYVYNCVSDHAFYAGAALLLSCTIPAFFIKKGTWLQSRAQTLAFWMMFVMSFPSFVDTSKFAVKSSHNETALFIVSAISLAANIAVFGYHFYKVFKNKRNPLTQEIHTDLDAYKQIVNENK